MIVATAGHVDHGKTELVRALSGVDTDRLPEEKARGLSIDLGFAYQPLAGGETLGFVDVPGHEKFIRNMLAGVAGIDLGLLVVAADDGVMPQTREHLAILDLLGIERYAVALSKIDRVDAARVQAVREQMAKLLAEFGHDGVPVFPVCAPRGVGIDALRLALQDDAQSPRQRDSGGRFRLAIDRAFSLRGVGLVVTGMAFAGETRVDDRLLLSRDGAPLRVRGIRVHDADSDCARAGQRCAIHVGGRGIGEDSLRRGDWLLHPELYAPTQRVDVELQVLASEPRALKHWTPVHLHHGAERVAARVAVLQGGAIAAGARGLAQLVLERDAFPLHGDRFVLRDQSARRTIGGGRVLDPFAPKRGRARPERIAALQAMRKNDAGAALAALAATIPQGVPLAPFTLARNLAAESVDRIVAADGFRTVGSAPDRRVFSDEQWRNLLERIEQAVDAYHEARPESPGASPRDIQLALQPWLEAYVVEAALAALVAANRLARRGARVHRPAHGLQVSAADRQLWMLATAQLAPASGSPLSLQQAAQALGIAPGVLEKSLKRAVKAGEMAQLTKNRYAPVAYLADLARACESLATEAADGAFTVAEYCRRTETGRNFAIDLLEHFDRLGFTERAGNQRRVRRPADTVFSKSGDMT